MGLIRNCLFFLFFWTLPILAQVDEHGTIWDSRFNYQYDYVLREDAGLDRRAEPVEITLSAKRGEVRMIHQETHPMAGKTVKLKEGIDHPQFELSGADFWVEDWWDRVTGGSWMFADGNPAAMIYGMRSGVAGLPTDNEVIYGKFGGLGVLVHVSEIETGR